MALAVAVSAGSAVPAFAASPLDPLSGSWSGNGTILLSGGESERIRCRASYAVEGGTKMQQKLRCASDSYLFEVESAVSYNEAAGVITGTWKETTRNVGGRVSGPAREGRLLARVDGGTFTADMEVKTDGDKQTVTIRAVNADVTEVAIDLTRS